MISWKSDSLGSVFSFFKNVFIWSISNKSVQFSSVAESRPTICGPMNCSTPGFSVHHQLLELTQIHVYWVGDAIQPSHPLSSPSPPTLNLSQHQSLFQWVGSSYQVAKVFTSTSVLPKNIQDWFPLGLTDWISLLSKGHSRIFSNTTVQKHQFFGTQLSLVQLSHPYMTTGKTIALTRWTFVGKVTSLLFNTLSNLVMAFLPRSKRLLISRLQSPSAVILGIPPKKVSLCFHYFPIYLP